MQNKVVLFLFLVLSVGVKASVGDVFSEMFFQDYRAGHCHENSRKLVKALFDGKAINQEFFLVKFENKGIGTFGLVNAEKARSFVQGKIIAEEKNWYEHWFVMDEMGVVYDFDFTSSPAPVPLSDYVEQMFLKEEECVTPSWTELCGGRDDKLKDYQVKVLDTKEGIEREVWSGNLKEFVEKNLPLHE